MAPQKDFYQVLGVPDSATPEQIKRAYRKLAKQYHPDAHPNDKAATEKFKELSEANSVLADAAKRKQYDLLRKYGAFSGGGPTRSQGGPAGPSGGGVRVEDLDLGDLGGFGGIGDLFSSIFGGGPKKRGEERGESIETVVSIPLRVAALGGKVPVVVPVTEACGTCNGSGAAPGSSVALCGECRGTGTISFGQGGFSVKRPCPACRGRGRVAAQRCGACAGAGDVRVEKRVMITVPSGTDTGSKIRLKGQGPRGSGGAEAGDLIVSFQMEPDRFFTREGVDILCSVTVNVAQAMLGTKLKVRTLDGKHVVLRVPAGTQPGRRFRIKGQGVDKGGVRGDQLVEIGVEIPSNLTPAQEELARQFAEAAELKH
jgi:molecular chaperone DnaJ